MRLLALALILLAGSAFADAVQPWRAIDLDRPGALGQLEHDNPAHYAKVAQILAEAPRRPFDSLGKWMRTAFDAKDVAASNLWKTSDPPLARITFTLGAQQYTKIIRLDVSGAMAPTKP
jgi:hypothetical protein